MTKAQQKKLLDDKWPKPTEKQRKAMFDAIKKASKARIFEYKEPDSDCSCSL